MTNRSAGKGGAGRIALPGTVLGVGLGRVRRRHPAAPDPAVAPHADQHRHRQHRGAVLPGRHRPGLQMNTLWDGLFHPFTWLAVLIGLGLLYSRVTALPRPGVEIAGAVGLDPRRMGGVQPGGGRHRPPPAGHPPRPERPAPDLVGPRVPASRRAAGRRRVAAAARGGPVDLCHASGRARARRGHDRPGARGATGTAPASARRRCALVVAGRCRRRVPVGVAARAPPS